MSSRPPLTQRHEHVHNDSSTQSNFGHNYDSTRTNSENTYDSHNRVENHYHGVPVGYQARNDDRVEEHDGLSLSLSRTRSRSLPPMSDWETYTRILLLAKHGYPLWNPDPSYSLPPEYRSIGVHFGDVGIVTGDGGFDYIFNIREEATSPINCNGVPKDFVPVSWERLSLSETREKFSPDPPGTMIHLESEKFSRGNPAHAATRSGDFEIRFSKPRGALLTLPDGATRFDYRKIRPFRQYAFDNAERWYEFVNGSLGREAENGSLYLITGTDTACTWENTAFSSSAEAVVIRLTSRNGKFTICDPTPGTIGRHMNSTVYNQAVFLRGFKIMLRGSLFARMKGRVKITSIEKSKGKQVMLRGRIVTISATSSSGQSSSNGSRGSRPRENVDSESVHDPNLDSDTDHASLSSSEVLETQMYHPSNKINEHLLQSNLNAKVAITHDDDWCSVLSKSELHFPEDAELIQLMTRYPIMTTNNGVYFDVGPPKGPPSRREKAETAITLKSTENAVSVSSPEASLPPSSASLPMMANSNSGWTNVGNYTNVASGLVLPLLLVARSIVQHNLSREHRLDRAQLIITECESYIKAIKTGDVELIRSVHPDFLDQMQDDSRAAEAYLRDLRVQAGANRGLWEEYNRWYEVQTKITPLLEWLREFRDNVLETATFKTQNSLKGLPVLPTHRSYIPNHPRLPLRWPTLAGPPDNAVAGPSTQRYPVNRPDHGIIPSPRRADTDPFLQSPNNRPSALKADLDPTGEISTSSYPVAGPSRTEPSRRHSSFDLSASGPVLSVTTPSNSRTANEIYEESRQQREQGGRSHHHNHSTQGDTHHNPDADYYPRNRYRR